MLNIASSALNNALHRRHTHTHTHTHISADGGCRAIREKALHVRKTNVPKTFLVGREGPCEC